VVRDFVIPIKLHISFSSVLSKLQPWSEFKTTGGPKRKLPEDMLSSLSVDLLTVESATKMRSLEGRSGVSRPHPPILLFFA
jgi:hypothetical protein